MMMLICFWLIPFVLFGLSRSLRAVARHRVERATAGWATAPGMVVETGLHDLRDWWQPAVSYTFTAAGRERASDQLRPGGTPYFHTERGAREALPAAAAAGQPITVYYDPQRPDRSAIDLRPNETYANSFRLLAIIAVAILAVVTLLSLIS